MTDDKASYPDSREGLAKVMGDSVRGQIRSSLAMVQKAVEGGWHIPDDWRRQLPAVAAAMAVDQAVPRRDRLRALQVLMTMQKHNVDAAVELDRMERLDADRPTEVGADKLTQQQLNLVQILVKDRLEGTT